MTQVRIPVLAKIILPLILIIILSVGISGYRVYRASTERWQSELDHRLERVAQLIAANVDTQALERILKPTDVDSPDYLLIQKQLDQAVTAGNLTWIGIYYRKDDRLYYWVDQGYTGVGYPFLYATADHLAAFDDQQMHRVHYTDEFGSYYGFVAPIVVQTANGSSSVVGLVEAVLDEESSQLLEQRTLSQVMPILIVGIVIAIGLTLMFTMLLFHRPLQQLEHGVLELADGQFGRQIPLRSNDELGDLAAAFNRMSGELERLYGQLRQYNRELEARVQSRTSELREERNRLNAILQNMADGLVVTDPAGTILLANPVFGQMVNTPIAQGSILKKVLPSQQVNELVADALSCADALTVQTTWKAAGWTSARVYKVTACALVEQSPGEDEHQVLGVVTVLRDVTYETQVDRMKTDFISMVSHELRTPLTSVLGFARLISKAFDRNIMPLVLPDDAHNQRAAQRIRGNLDIIVGEGERLTRLINDVLDIAKIEAGKIEWHMEDMQIEDAIQNAVAATVSLASEKGLPLHVDIAQPLPAICADRDRMIQVMTNLLSNAIKFTDRGEIRIAGGRLQITDSQSQLDDLACKPPICYLPPDLCLEPGTWIWVSVRDSGIGISADNLPKIFEKFKQVGDTITNRPRGTGLGLSICKEIVEHHGGHIWAESQLDVGTTLIFVLPALSLTVNYTVQTTTTEPSPLPVLEEIRRRIAQALPEAQAQSQDAAHILVVDDEATIRELLRQMLTEAGYQIVEATDGVDALQKARQTHPDLIILDLMLPGISGFDVISALRNDPDIATIPVMILSILQDRIKGLQLGADAYLTKPLNTEQVLATIERLLARPERSCELPEGAERPKVLIIDQDAAVVETIARVFAERDCQVIKAYNSQEGIAQAIQERPRFIILGATVSRLNDHEVLHTLKYARETQGADIVLMSAL